MYSVSVIRNILACPLFFPEGCLCDTYETSSILASNHIMHSSTASVFRSRGGVDCDFLPDRCVRCSADLRVVTWKKVSRFVRQAVV